MTTRSRQASPDRAKPDPAPPSQPPPAPPQQIPPPQRDSSLPKPAASHTAQSLRHPQSKSFAQLSFRHCPTHPKKKSCSPLSLRHFPIYSSRTKQNLSS